MINSRRGGAACWPATVLAERYRDDTDRAERSLCELVRALLKPSASKGAARITTVCVCVCFPLRRLEPPTESHRNLLTAQKRPAHSAAI